MSEKEKKKLSIKDLPNDYMIYLFSNYLDFNCKLEVEKVCKLWHQLIGLSFATKRCLIISDFELHSSRIKSLNVSQQYRKVSIVKMVSFHRRDRTEAKDKGFLSLIIRKYRNLETLSLSLKYTKCNDKVLELICKYCGKTLTNLRIEMSECSVNNRTLIVSHSEVQMMIERFPNLRYLYMDFVILLIQEQSLHTIFSKCPNIETVIFHTPCFRGCVYNSELENSLSSEFVGDHIGDSVGPSVVKLELPANILNVNAIGRLPTTTTAVGTQLFRLLHRQPHQRGRHVWPDGEHRKTGSLATALHRYYERNRN